VFGRIERSKQANNLSFVPAADSDRNMKLVDTVMRSMRVGKVGAALASSMLTVVFQTLAIYQLTLRLPAVCTSSSFFSHCIFNFYNQRRE
jgi:hypothetical protein